IITVRTMLSLIPTTIFIRRGLLTDISFFLSLLPSSYCIHLGCGLKKAPRNLGIYSFPGVVIPVSSSSCGWCSCRSPT
ncbi:hypothetical protein BDB00DRAFT_850638, partial [Zychaea mexicana]|uniref:uncharacterized protein n=1 Tax=Zychaea mexicana TaxID=64656 RepID=UPI0022FF28F2